MLTKSDLQQIGGLLDKKLEEKLEQKLEEKLEQKLSPIKKDVQNIKRQVQYIHKTVSLIVKNYDEGDVKLAKRVDRIEEHLGLSRKN
jgi:hypothetical protein